MNVVQFKIELREQLPGNLEQTFSALRQTLPKEGQKYEQLLLLESRHNDIRRQVMEGIAREEEIQVARNQVRKSLLELINSLEERDFSPALNEIAQRKRTRPFPVFWFFLGLILLVSAGFGLFQLWKPTTDSEVFQPQLNEDSLQSETPALSRQGQGDFVGNTKDSPSQPSKTVPPKKKQTTPSGDSASPAEAPLYYVVNVVVDADGTDSGTLLIDGQPPEMIESTANVKKIRVKQKDIAHVFEWQTGSLSCRKEALITRDRQQVTLPCN